MYFRKQIYSIDKVFNIYQNQNFVLDGDVIKNSQRYLVFTLKGTKCVKCGLQGTFFAKEMSKGAQSFHLNLYGLNKKGSEIMLTKDHIQAKSKGGKDHIDNYQTMCQPCNVRKGSTHESK